jgi:hypothetical protein
MGAAMNQFHIRPEPDQKTLSFSFFAGPAAWALLLIVGYGLASQACLAGTKVVLYAACAVAGVIAFLSAVLGYRNWRWLSAQRGMLQETEDSDTRQTFVAVSGALLSTVFFLLVVMTAVSMIFLMPCPVISLPLP